jgi:uncharacterized protein (TIGR00255 family)
MTGFGGAASRDFTVEIRSLNHRFIDISIKMPQFMSQYEIPLRNILKERFQRGRFDVSVSLTGGKTAQITMNKDLARSIYTALRELKEELSLYGEIGMETLTAYRELLMEEEPTYDFEELRTTFNEAASHLEKAASSQMISEID